MEDIFVSKIKRLAVAMFAALCVGYVWGTHITVDVSNVAISETGDLTFQYRLGYWESSTIRYGYLKVDLLDSNDVILKTHEIIKKSDNNKLENKNYDSADPISDRIEGITELTGCSSIDALCEAGYAIVITFRSFQSGKGFDYGDVKLFMANSGITSLNATFTVNPKEFVISGEYDKTAGITDIEFQYALNDASMSNPKTQGRILTKTGRLSYVYRISRKLILCTIKQ